MAVNELGETIEEQEMSEPHFERPYDKACAILLKHELWQLLPDDLLDIFMEYGPPKDLACLERRLLALLRYNELQLSATSANAINRRFGLLKIRNGLSYGEILERLRKDGWIVRTMHKGAQFYITRTHDKNLLELFGSDGEKYDQELKNSCVMARNR